LPASRWSRGFDWLRGTPTGLVALALVVGAGAGLGAVAFRYLILWFTRLFSGHDDYSSAGRAVNHWVPWLGILFVLAAPVVGGAIYGPVVQRFAREARGHGVPEVMLAVAERGGRIAPQVAVVKALASALCIGSGGSVGREGPIVQIGSALGSSLGQLVRLPEKRLRLLVACGAAGGISATFNAPIAGVFFAMELILGDFGVESFGAVVLASVTAAVIGRAAFGDQPFLHLPAFHLTSPAEFGAYAVLGLAAAVVGIAFVKVLYGIEDLADKLWRGPEWLRPAAGGLLLGGLLLALPQMYGVGYPVLSGAVDGRYVLWFLLVLLVGKMVATSLTIAVGGSGGVFAPSLFLGAMAGTAFGTVGHAALPGIIGSAGAYGIVGMGAVFAATSRAPITAVLIIFELTGDYSIILPLMTAVVVATAVSRKLSPDTIYTLKLRRRGIDLQRGRSASLLETLTVAAAMRPVPPAALAADGLGEVLARLDGADGRGGRRRQRPGHHRRPARGRHRGPDRVADPVRRAAPAARRRRGRPAGAVRRRHRTGRLAHPPRRAGRLPRHAHRHRRPGPPVPSRPRRILDRRADAEHRRRADRAARPPDRLAAGHPADGAAPRRRAAPGDRRHRAAPRRPAHRPGPGRTRRHPHRPPRRRPPGWLNGPNGVGAGQRRRPASAPRRAPWRPSTASSATVRQASSVRPSGWWPSHPGRAGHRHRPRSHC
jgi:CIC family chloride channel protein